MKLFQFHVLTISPMKFSYMERYAKFNVAFEVDSSDCSLGRPTVGLYLTNSSLCVLLVNL
jgi:hypothetical protein